MTTPTRKFTFPEAMWAGTDHSLELARDVHELMMAGLFDQTATAIAAPDAEAPYQLQPAG